MTGQEQGPHNEALAEKLRQIAAENSLGATGEYPQGKLTEGDEGELRIAVGAEGGKVIINFGKAVAWLGMDPRQARALAESIRQASYRAE